MPVLSTIGSAPFIKGGRSYYPLRNTATDPTSASWRINNPGYVFVPNVGIYAPAPITIMASMFADNATFNDSDVSLWDTSSVTNMQQVFQSATVFNQNIGSWNLSNVTVTFFMFNSAAAFNQNISTWNVSNVTNMAGMFQSARAFNCGQASGVAHNLMQRTATGGWRTNSVTGTGFFEGMYGMFNVASSFNGNISAWCVTNIPTVPDVFAERANANFTVARQPQWGTCTIP